MNFFQNFHIIINNQDMAHVDMFFRLTVSQFIVKMGKMYTQYIYIRSWFLIWHP